MTYVTVASMRKNKAALFLLSCLVLLFMPGVGDLRWIGLMAFLYIGLPWYILALKDSVEEKIEANLAEIPIKRGFSPTLVIFGAISAVIGVAIDLFILYQAWNSPDMQTIFTSITRLLIGIPFFGFGIYLLFLGIGKLSKNI